MPYLVSQVVPTCASQARTCPPCSSPSSRLLVEHWTYEHLVCTCGLAVARCAAVLKSILRAATGHMSLIVWPPARHSNTPEYPGYPGLVLGIVMQCPWCVGDSQRDLSKFACAISLMLPIDLIKKQVGDFS